MQACRRVSVEPMEHTGESGGWGCRWLEAPGSGAAPVLYVHGVPNTGSVWRPFLERTGGLAPDLPGFGESAKPAAFDYSIAGLSGWLKSFLADREVERYSLVAHDWGALALALAQAEPERVERLVLLDAVPLLPGYEWHKLARQWRRPLVGEMAMGFTFKFVTRRLLRLPDGSDFPAEELDDIWDHFDHGTQRAILRLYRSAPPRALEAAGADLGKLSCPALVVWGDTDPYLPTSFAHDYAAALGGPAEVEVVEGAGHWPWIGHPDVVDRVAAFLA
jgi:pimeloyl-ACP methyl ester carboxylesterase